MSLQLSTKQENTTHNEEKSQSELGIDTDSKLVNKNTETFLVTLFHLFQELEERLNVLRHERCKKQPNKLLEMKPTMAEFLKRKKSLHRINNNTDIAGKKTNEPDDIAIKTIQNQTCTHTKKDFKK